MPASNRQHDSNTVLIHLGGAVACVSLLGIGWFFGLSPMMNQSSQELAVIREAERADDQARLSQVSLESLTQQLDRSAKLLEQQPINLDPASQINPLLAALAEWAQRHQIDVTLTRADRPEALEYYDYVPIRLAGECAFADLSAFLSRLHAERADLGLIGFSIDRMPISSRVLFELDLAWYVERDVEQMTPATTATVPTR